LFKYHFFYSNWKSEFVLPSDLTNLLSFMFELGEGERRGLIYYYNLANCCVVLVKILKCSHLFRKEDVCAPVGEYGKVHLLKVVFRKQYGDTCSFYEWDHELIMCWHRKWLVVNLSGVGWLRGFVPILTLVRLWLSVPDGCLVGVLVFALVFLLKGFFVFWLLFDSSTSCTLVSI